jgi:NADPH2:quinone reductase
VKAIRVNRHGGTDVLTYEDVEVGDPGPGKARVRTAASGVNFIDVYMRTGVYPGETPFTLGLEGAGEVEAVGDGVEDLSVGDYVAWAGVPGSCAEYVVAPAEKLVPFNVTLVEARVAAAIMLQGMTAHYLTHSTFPLEDGNVALVHAAAGGVGLAPTLPDGEDARGDRYRDGGDGGEGKPREGGRGRRGDPVQAE